MSATTVHADLRAAVRQRLLTLNGLPAQAWEGRTYTPIKGTPYISESVRPISSVVRALGVGGTIAHTITANFQLHYPAGGGTTAIDAMAGNLLEHFRPGTTLVYSESKAVVQQAERTALQQEPDWINCTVIIRFVGYTVN